MPIVTNMIHKLGQATESIVSSFHYEHILHTREEFTRSAYMDKENVLH